ncbi:hypothetical protein VNO80_20004 [Phaseolus coccineus]|uniref:Uncharacterized protein n=1 Tax=Phaseolus coccineus TaxID=3886 RepID=A0AAN9MH77_PHACN
MLTLPLLILCLTRALFFTNFGQVAGTVPEQAILLEKPTKASSFSDKKLVMSPVLTALPTSNYRGSKHFERDDKEFFGSKEEANLDSDRNSSEQRQTPRGNCGCSSLTQTWKMNLPSEETILLKHSSFQRDNDNPQHLTQMSL